MICVFAIEKKLRMEAGDAKFQADRNAHPAAYETFV